MGLPKRSSSISGRGSRRKLWSPTGRRCRRTGRNGTGRFRRKAASTRRKGRAKVRAREKGKEKVKRQAKANDLNATTSTASFPMAILTSVGILDGLSAFFSVPEHFIACVSICFWLQQNPGI